MNVHVRVQHSDRDVDVEVQDGSTLIDVLTAVGYPKAENSWLFRLEGGTFLPHKTRVVRGMKVTLIHRMADIISHANR